ncbi:MAG TPA: acetate--CoA ligase family protein [Thermodesulfobacteriota bacterium]|nr:acetate--CoA ligase family protein [Thermodesulfobacteriota bacterium]
MDIQKILMQAIGEKKHLLSEDVGKALISQYGMNVPPGKRVNHANELRSAARKLGYPLVVKVMAPDLIHKSDRGAVKMGIIKYSELRRATEELWTLFPGVPLLVEKMATPGVELILGLTHDHHFGPNLMIGLGGIFTEVFQDVAFLMLPAKRNEVSQALTGLKGFKLLTGFRGKPAYDIDRILDAIMGVAQFGLDAAGYYESVDINPFVVNEDGVTALDVKVLLRPEYVPLTQEVSSRAESLGRFFTPRSVAVIGVSTATGKSGNVVIRNILANDYKGKIYLVNPKGGEILGMPVQPSIASLPEGIDLAIVVLPAKETPQALRECAGKGIKQIVLLAGGFAEVDEYGAEIQQEMIDIIRETGIRVIGPNTSGHTSTPHQFTSSLFPLGKLRRGKISYLAQTGNFATHTMRYILTGEHFGVARVIGLGNKIDIEESEALKYLAEDSETHAIIMYLESIKKPKRFLEIAREVTRHKPVVMLKGGITEAGKKAAVAHTAAMASEDRLIDGLIRQAGIVRVRNYTHLILAGKALSMIPLPKGNRVSFLTPSGAMLVVLSDLCISLGLEVPELEEETRQRLQEISPPYIRMRNPVDIWAAASVKGVEYGYGEGMEAVLKDPNIDAVVPVLMLTRETGIPSYNFILELAKKYPEKPILVTFSADKQYMDEFKELLEPRGVPTFPEIEQPFEVLSILYRCKKAMNRAW